MERDPGKLEQGEEAHSGPLTSYNTVTAVDSDNYTEIRLPSGARKNIYVHFHHNSTWECYLMIDLLSGSGANQRSFPIGRAPIVRGSGCTAISSGLYTLPPKSTVSIHGSLEEETPLKLLLEVKIALCS